MEIGTIIKKHRRQRDMTQEQLAEYLRVSVSAVSQWESGKTAPDLALIPAICNLFGISADELLGINLEQKEKRISDIEDQACQHSSRGQLHEAAVILEAGLREFPDSYGIIHDLMYVRFNQYCAKHDCLYELDEAIRLANRILDGCTIDGYREAASKYYAIPTATRANWTKPWRLHEACHPFISPIKVCTPIYRSEAKDTALTRVY
ncbi:MAG: helix-turn-helix transcriptional regulator [Clostridia bacterium]|nr:helix-turn-helix transcriptional regulator [Clostridia bacterium]